MPATTWFLDRDRDFDRDRDRIHKDDAAAQDRVRDRIHLTDPLAMRADEIYGSELMTKKERKQYRKELAKLKTLEEREQGVTEDVVGRQAFEVRLAGHGASA